MRFLRIAILASTIAAAACGKGDKPPAPTSGAPNAPRESGPKGGGEPTATAGSPADEARQLFTTVCATCHGANGGGDGPAANSLNPRPRNYTDPAWQASVTDDDIKKTILEGGQAVGKSAMMPAQTQLRDKPAVVDELVKLIRSFGKK